MPNFKFLDIAGKKVKTADQLIDLFKTSERGLGNLIESHRRQLFHWYEKLVEAGLIELGSGNFIKGFHLEEGEIREIEDIITFASESSEEDDIDLKLERINRKMELLKIIQRKFGEEYREKIQQNIRDFKTSQALENLINIPLESDDFAKMLRSALDECILQEELDDNSSDEPLPNLTENPNPTTALYRLVLTLMQDELFINGKFLKEFTLNSEDAEAIKISLAMAAANIGNDNIFQRYINDIVDKLRNYLQPQFFSH